MDTLTTKMTTFSSFFDLPIKFVQSHENFVYGVALQRLCADLFHLYLEDGRKNANAFQDAGRLVKSAIETYNKDFTNGRALVPLKLSEGSYKNVNGKVIHDKFATLDEVYLLLPYYKSTKSSWFSSSIYAFLTAIVNKNDHANVELKEMTKKLETAKYGTWGWFLRVSAPFSKLIEIQQGCSLPNSNPNIFELRDLEESHTAVRDREERGQARQSPSVNPEEVSTPEPQQPSRQRLPSFLQGDFSNPWRDSLSQMQDSSSQRQDPVQTQQQQQQRQQTPTRRESVTVDDSSSVASNKRPHEQALGDEEIDYETQLAVMKKKKDFFIEKQRIESEAETEAFEAIVKSAFKLSEMAKKVTSLGLPEALAFKFIRQIVPADFSDDVVTDLLKSYKSQNTTTTFDHVSISSPTDPSAVSTRETSKETSPTLQTRPEKTRVNTFTHTRGANVTDFASYVEFLKNSIASVLYRRKLFHNREIVDEVFLQLQENMRTTRRSVLFSPENYKLLTGPSPDFATPHLYSPQELRAIRMAYDDVKKKKPYMFRYAEENIRKIL